jgi:hypothetical protein
MLRSKAKADAKQGYFGDDTPVTMIAVVGSANKRGGRYVI